VGIAGVGDAVLIAHSALAVADGKKYVVTAIVVGERFPEGALEGTVLHWGCSGSKGGSWQPPPAGWHTLPPISRPAGRASLSSTIRSPFRGVHAWGSQGESVGAHCHPTPVFQTPGNGMDPGINTSAQYRRQAMLHRIGLGGAYPKSYLNPILTLS
jgi:hypothetical protein